MMQTKRHYPSEASVARWNEVLDLSTAFSKSWDIGASASGYLFECIARYEGDEMSDEDRFALMCLLLECYNEYHMDTPPPWRSAELYATIRGYLCRDFELHEPRIACLVADGQEGRVRHITLLARDVWNEMRGALSP